VRRQEPKFSLLDSKMSLYWLVKAVCSLHLQASSFRLSSITSLASDTSLEPGGDSSITRKGTHRRDTRGENNMVFGAASIDHGTRTVPVKGCKAWLIRLAVALLAVPVSVGSWNDQCQYLRPQKFEGSGQYDT
jgi:hypothetical protein